MTCRVPIALTLCVAAAVALAAEPIYLDGRIVGIADGDTITLLDASKQQHKIRLDGIDAPEKAQPFGNRSKQSLSDLAFGRDTQAHCPKVDRYNRRVCKVIVNNIDVGLEQIRRGKAWHFKRFEREQSEQDRAAYATAENKARSRKLNLWRDADPLPPWKWRAARSSQ